MVAGLGLSRHLLQRGGRRAAGKIFKSVVNLMFAHVKIFEPTFLRNKIFETERNKFMCKKNQKKFFATARNLSTMSERNCAETRKKQKVSFLSPKKGVKMVIFGYLNNSKSGGFRRYIVNDENAILHPPKIPPFLTISQKWCFSSF